MAHFPVPDYRALGHQIARLRAQRKWSIDRLAEEANVSRKSVINTEGAHNVPTLAMLHGLAHGLGVPLSDLVVTLCARHSGQRGPADRDGRGSR